MCVCASLRERKDDSRACVRTTIWRENNTRQTGEKKWENKKKERLSYTTTRNIIYYIVINI